MLFEYITIVESFEFYKFSLRLSTGGRSITPQLPINIFFKQCMENVSIYLWWYNIIRPKNKITKLLRLNCFYYMFFFFY